MSKKKQAVRPHGWPTKRDGTDRDLVDAPQGQDERLNIRARDVVTAKPGDGEYCVVARCVARALDAHMVYVFKSVVYVAWDDDDTPVLRYKASAGLRRSVIDHLDTGHPELIVTGRYSLLAPTPKQRLGVDRTRRPGAERRKPRLDRGHAPIGQVDRNAVFWKGLRRAA